MKALVVITFVFAGCYSPSVDDCQYECSSDFNAACPDGMFCNAESFCVNDPEVLCGFEPPFDGNTDIDGSMPPFDVFPPDDSFVPPPDSTMPDGGGPVMDAAVAETPSIHDTPNDVTDEPVAVEPVSGTGLAVP
jgi:hypothetical protein